jgi:4-amino-4-deoxy-L-arabinose transferase-like glycosyltransferase
MENLRKLKNKSFIFLTLIILFAGFIRFYQLGNIPAGLTNDEANVAYDAYSLLHTARDQWNTFLPVNNFIGFGDFQPPMFRYTSIIPIAIFGLNQFSIRFVSALAGVLSVLVLYFLIKKIVNEKAALISSLLLAIMPWAFGLNRMGHESNIAILFLIVGLIFGFTYKSTKSLFLSAFFFTLCMYTYSAYILYAPLCFLIILLFNYKKEGYKKLIFPLIFFLVLISPILFQKNSASVRFDQVGFTTNINSIGLINDLNDQRGQCLSLFNPIVCKITENKVPLFISTFVKNYFSHFSPNFLYMNGTQTQFSILPQRGLDYLFNFLPLILGFYFLIFKNKNRKAGIAFIILFLVTPIADSLTSDGNYTRASMMQPFIAGITGIGFYFLFFDLLSKYKRLKSSVILVVALLISFSFISFYVVYLTYFKNNYSIYSLYGYKELMTNVSSLENNYDRIYLTRHLNDTKQYIYYLFYTKYDPAKYQSKKDVTYSMESNGWYSIDRIGKIYFVQNPPTIMDGSTLASKKILIISNPVDFPKELNPVFEIKDKLGNVLFKAINLSDLLKYNREHQPKLSI